MYQIRILGLVPGLEIRKGVYDFEVKSRVRSVSSAHVINMPF